MILIPAAIYLIRLSFYILESILTFFRAALKQASAGYYLKSRSCQIPSPFYAK